MTHRKLIAGTAVLAVAAIGGGSTASASRHSVSNKATIKAVEKDSYKVNRYLKLGLRWNKDNYNVKSGGTLKIVNNAPDAGPHTWSVVRKKDLPRTKKQLDHCKICEQLGEAHGATGDGPPTYQYLENGKGENDAPPEVDQAGDSALLGFNKGDVTSLHVTAKKGKTLHFMCIIHPWMQGKLHVR